MSGYLKMPCAALTWMWFGLFTIAASSPCISFSAITSPAHRNVYTSTSGEQTHPAACQPGQGKPFPLHRELTAPSFLPHVLLITASRISYQTLQHSAITWHRLFSRFIVFVTYQMYYDYPPPTYLEYPILIAQGELCWFQTRTYLRTNRNTVVQWFIHSWSPRCPI